MIWVQREISLEPRSRGFHLITDDVLNQLDGIDAIGAGILHIFIKHTSASLTLNEDASPDVLRDFERYFNDAVPADAPYWEHTIEGPDDMPAHIKASMLGSSVSIPITDGRPALGTWQGIYLCEHRARARRRRLIATAYGEEAE